MMTMLVGGRIDSRKSISSGERKKKNVYDTPNDFGYDYDRR